METGAVLCEHRFDPELKLDCLSNNGKYLALYGKRVNVDQAEETISIVYEAESAEKVLAISNVGRLVFSGDESQALTYSGRYLSVWNLPRGNLEHTSDIGAPGRPESLASLALSPTGRLIAVGGYATSSEVAIFDVESGRKLAEVLLDKEDDIVERVAFFDEGRSIAVSNYAQNAVDKDTEPLIRCWKLPPFVFSTNPGK